MGLLQQRCLCSSRAQCQNPGSLAHGQRLTWRAVLTHEIDGFYGNDVRSSRIVVDGGIDAIDRPHVLLGDDRSWFADGEHLSIIKEDDPVRKSRGQVHVMYRYHSGDAPLLDEANISYTLVKDGDSFDVQGVKVEGFEYDHEEIHPRLEVVRNTGFLIADHLYYGGDALQAPKRDIKVLALPVAGPWLRVREAIDFCLEIKPRVAFPVHDGILVGQLGGSHKAPKRIFDQEQIEWVIPELHQEFEV